MEIDYKEYEDRVRKADSGYMKNILRKYVAHFQGRRRVLDIACGRGDFLSLAREAGINAIGIDNDPSIVKCAADAGLTVHRCDAFEFLEKNTEPFDGVFCSQYIEHLGPDDLMRLLALIHRNLTDDGIVILTTPNSRSLIVHLQSFYKDFSHVRFYDIDLVKFMMECAKFRVADAGFDQDTSFQMPLMAPRTIENTPFRGKADNGPDSTQILSQDHHTAYADKLGPTRQKGPINGIKYYVDRVVYRLIRRYLFGIYDDMRRYDEILSGRQSRLEKANIIMRQRIASNEEQLKKENEVLSAVLELVKMNEASYNSFISGIYMPHDIYVKGVKLID